MVGIFHEGDGRIADLAQVKSADITGHAHSDAFVGGYQDVGEGGGKEGGLLQLSIVVVNKIHCILVDIPEHLDADTIQPSLRVPAGGPGHIPGVDLTKVTLGVHKRMEQGTIALGQTDHRIVDGRVAMWVQFHGGAHNIGTLGPGPAKQVHLVHGVQQLPVAGLESVDFRNGPGNDDAHGVGHVVVFQGVGDRLLLHF